MKVRIRELLKERGMTTAQLAAKAGADQKSINSLVTRASFTVGSLSRYAAPLNVPTWELVHDCGVSAIGHEPADNAWIEHPITTLRVEALMQEQHINRAELARRMGVSGASVTMTLNRGTDKLSAVVIEKLMNALNVPVWQLFVSEDEYYGEVARRKGCTADDVRRQMQGERDKALGEVVSDLQINNEQLTMNNEASLGSGMNNEASPSINNSQLTNNNEASRGSGMNNSQSTMNNGITELFAQMEREEEANSQRIRYDESGHMVVSDGEYRYGQYVVRMRDGEVTVMVAHRKT